LNKFTESVLAEKVSAGRQSTHITDVRARQKTSRNSIIVLFNRSGWTQEKVAEILKLSEKQIFAISTLTYPGQ